MICSCGYCSRVISSTSGGLMVSFLVELVSQSGETQSRHGVNVNGDVAMGMMRLMYVL